jgi:nicotinamidase-related amidase
MILTLPIVISLVGDWLIRDEKLMIKSGDCVLLVIDVQDRLINTILQSKELVRNVKALILTARVLGIPVLVTEQEKLGGTVAELEKILVGAPKVHKLDFSGCAKPEFIGNLEKSGKKTVVACGIEAHICVLQTVLDLLERGYGVVVPVDAISAYATTDNDMAVERMKEAGAVAATVEALIYEWIERAGTDEFRKVLEIVKEKRGYGT